MAKSKRKRAPKSVLKLPDLEQSRSAVLNSLTSPSSQRTYDHAIREFIEWYCSEPRLAFNKTVVTRYTHFPGTAALCLNYHQSAAGGSPEAGLRGCRLRSAQCRLGCRDSPGKGCQALGRACRQLAHRGTGQAPSVDGGHAQASEASGTIATLAILLGCGLRRAELTALRVEDIQQREEHWVIADLVGKGGHIRTIPVPDWVKAGIDSWMQASGISTGTLLRSINKAGRIWGAASAPRSSGAS